LHSGSCTSSSSGGKFQREQILEEEGGKEGIPKKEGRKEGKNIRRKEKRKEGIKEGRKKRRKE
jgi:hypothetical protein